MEQHKFYVIIGIIALVSAYVLWRLRRLEDLVRHYKLKNQEGVGAWSKTRNPLFLLLAVLQGIYCVLHIAYQGFESMDIYRTLFLVGLPLYLYFRDDA